MSSIPLFCSLREHQQVCIMLSAKQILACHGSSGDGGLNEFKTAKKKICNNNLLQENFE